MPADVPPAVRLLLTGSPSLEVVDARTSEMIAWWAGPARGAEVVSYVASHPGGAALVDVSMALWWRVEPSIARKKFHDALGAWHMNLRRASGHGKELSVVVRTGKDFYRIAENVTVDVAEFQRLHQKATATVDSATAIELHVAAASQIRGPLLGGGCDYLWSAAPRADLSRDVKLNFARLDRLLSEQERPWDSVNVLLRSLEVDCCAEAVVRRLMRLYEQLDHPELAVSECHRLRDNLAQIGRKLSAATVRLYREICRRHRLA